jgi:hypothetical protein
MLTCLSMLVVCLLTALPASAQPIHGHPQKAAYASPAEWPAIDSQGWRGDPDPMVAGHVHVIPKFPAYAVIADWSTIEVPFTLKAHNIAGTIEMFTGEHVRSVRWDATGTSEMPNLRGDPNGLLEWTGVATVDLTLGDDGFLHIFKFPLHGWAEVRFFTRTVLDNGDFLDVSSVVPVYSLIDPTAPEALGAEQGNPGVHVRTSVVVWRNNQALAGELVTEISDYVPLAPISSPWPTIANVYNYTAPAGVPFENERFELRLDADLHHGVAGSLLQVENVGLAQNKQFLGPIFLNPAAMGTGPHKILAVWTQPLGAEAVSAALIFPVAVSDGVPVPTICTDPTALNVGGLLPCRFAAPAPASCLDPNAPNFNGPLPCLPPLVHVPVVTYVPFTPLLFERQFIDGFPQNVFKFCLTQNECFSFKASPIQR